MQSHWHVPGTFCAACGGVVPGGESRQPSAVSGPPAAASPPTPHTPRPTTPDFAPAINRHGEQIAAIEGRLGKIEKSIEEQGKAWNAAAEALKKIDDVARTLRQEHGERIVADEKLAADLEAKLESQTRTTITNISAEIKAELEAQLSDFRLPTSDAPPSGPLTSDVLTSDLAGAAIAAAAAAAGIGIPAWAIVAGWKAIGYVGKRRRQRKSRTEHRTDAGAGEAPAARPFPGTTR